VPVTGRIVRTSAAYHGQLRLLFQTYARSFDRVWHQTRSTWNGQEVIDSA
jgi:hypothetical protein